MSLTDLKLKKNSKRNLSENLFTILAAIFTFIAVTPLIFVLLYVLIGGTQTAWGPLVGASFFTLIPEALRIGDDWRFFIFGVIIVIMMIFRPEGIVTRDALERVWRQLFSGKRNV